MNIIGISALYHDSSCCILKNGQLVAAVQEERFTRRKNESVMPCESFKYCLDEANLSINDIDCLAYYEKPVQKLSRQLWSGFDMHFQYNDSKNPLNTEKEIRELLGYEGEIQYIGHHLSHAAGAYYYSGFDEAAVLTMDGVGEWATTSYNYANSQEIRTLEEVYFPHSLGLFYAAITSYLGFRINSGEYKVMGLAPYGNPIYEDKLWEIIKNGERGQFRLNLPYYDFIKANCMYSELFIDLMKQPPRVPESEITQYHMDLAKSLQCVLEKIILNKVTYLKQITNSDNLCLSGGVALNVVANSKIQKEKYFKNIFVQPAASDAGNALGAAAAAYTNLTGKRIPNSRLEHVYLGPQNSYDEIESILSSTLLEYTDYVNKTDELIKVTAELLAQGKVVGWFQDRMEFGPRALGNRSILADPRVNDMRDKLNRMVKKREQFRPFAPAVMEEKASDHFDMDSPSPFMLCTCQVISDIDLPAITHVDGTARVQTVNDKFSSKFYRLIEEFYRQTNCPIILNTSFNVRGEPIIMTAIDAIKCFVNTNIDILVLGDFLIDRKKNHMAKLKSVLRISDKSPTEKNVYTFI